MHRQARQRAQASSIWRGDFWAPIACLLAGLVAVGALVAALPQPPPSGPQQVGPEREALGSQLAKSEEAVRQWRAAIEDLCKDATLRAEELAVDCQTGAVTFGDELFDPDDTTQLGGEGIRKLHLAMTAVLSNLRSYPRAWQNLESIELRGHADPRARRDPYVTNMRVSQQRPMSIMLYLISDWGLSEQDRSDLQRLLVRSAASHSRPPRRCPERTRECYPFWRRVEIIPRMRVSALQTSVQQMSRQLIDLLEHRADRSAASVPRATSRPVF